MLRLFLVLTLLAGCAQRTEFRIYDRAPAASQRVFVGTTRATSDTEEFGPGRSAGMRHLALDVSVPPRREAGDASRPRGTLDPESQFFFHHREDFADRAAHVRALKQSLDRLPVSQRYAVIFVHGFNTTFSDGVLRLAQIASDFELGGVAMHYAWPSRASPLGYEYDKDSVMIARDGLEQLIADARAAGAREVVVMAHSMGAFLTMETLRQMEIARKGSVRRSVNAVVLVSPDIDVEVFRSQALRIGPLPDVFAIFVSRRDRALGLSALLSGQQQRLGNINEASELADLNVTLLDVSAFSTGMGHFTLASSPALIALFSRAGEIDSAFRAAASQNTGLLSGVVITLQGATQLVLQPLAEVVN